MGFPGSEVQISNLALLQEFLQQCGSNCLQISVECRGREKWVLIGRSLREFIRQSKGEILITEKDAKALRVLATREATIESFS